MEIVELTGLEASEDSPTLLQSKQKYSQKLHSYETIPDFKRPCIVIDNGSYSFRGGWNFEEKPYLNFRSLVAKPKTFYKEISTDVHLVGNEINMFDPGKIATRSPFDKNVVYHISS